MSTLKQVNALGQSIWLDFISRKLIDSGELHRLVESDGLGGVTSNPSIFEKSLREGSEYAAELARLRKARPGAQPFELYEDLAVRDIQDACDVLRPVWDKKSGRDGFVSLEVTLHRGDSAEEIVREARHLWKKVARPNVMIKVPGTAAGRKAFETLISEGINVNVTLLFARTAYAETVEAYLRGLEARSRAGGDLSRVASVASFFVSRIDSAVDKLLKERIEAAASSKEKKSLEKLLGRAAIANAKLAYAHYEEIVASKRWRDLAKLGAQPQRVLWASTGTKDKAYSDVMYVEELIGPDTVNTAPPATIDAFRDHGRARVSLTEGMLDAKKVLRDLESRGIALDQVTDKLLVDGLKLFGDAFDTLVAAIAAGESAAPAAPAAAFTPQTESAPQDIARAFEAALTDWEKHKKLARLWKRDATLWTGGDEARWLAWLDAPAAAAASVGELTAFADEIRKEGIRHVLVLGMGGSSLCPDVLARTFGTRAGWPALAILDSTDPDQVRARARSLDLTRTIAIVASKSGSTLEPELLDAYFWDAIRTAVGADKVGSRFVAITDPGSKLERSAKERKFRKIFHGEPRIGGRYSALSPFGLVPAALSGVDLARFTERAASMARACGPDVAARTNPGVRLGLFLGAAARVGRDKLTIVASPQIAALGAWLEQLVAESTGKNGRAILPIDGEPLGTPDSYGPDRVFAYLRLARAPDEAQERAVAALERAGCAVVRIDVASEIDLGAEFFRWELATAVAGAVLGIHPFDQPDVEASKVATRALTSAFEKTGALPEVKPFFDEEGISLYAAPVHVRKLYASTGARASLADVLRAHLALEPGDYVAFLAWLPMDSETQAALDALRASVRAATRAATTAGFGPRFLHSTGQAHKGGPPSGVFVHLTRAVREDLAVPGRGVGFGLVQTAQARGDQAVLAERGRRSLCIHFSQGVQAGLATLRRAVEQALAQPAAAAKR